MTVRVASETAPLVLRHARDVVSHNTLNPLEVAQARLTGLLTHVRRHKTVAFLTLQDATGSIQLLADSVGLSSAAWQDVCALRQGDRVTAQGRVGVSNTGQVSLLLASAPRVMDKELGASLAQGEMEYARVGAQILAARLRGRASQYFRAVGYEEIEPRIISASWRSPGLEPLRVNYEGFGVQAYLAPSPASQLLETLLVTGVERTFAVSRCFSTTYRDEKSSNESMILVAKAVAMTANDLREMLRRAIVEILGDLETLPENIAPLLTGWSDEELSWPPTPGGFARQVPTFEVYPTPAPLGPGDERTLVTDVSRAVWPPDRVIAETAHETLESGLEVATCTLHLDRMVTLLRDVPIRQLRHLGGSADTVTARLEVEAEAEPGSRTDVGTQ